MKSFRVDENEDDEKVELEREWAMPNKSTFSIKPINTCVENVLKQFPNGVFCDPFVGKFNPFSSRMKYSNDLNPEISATHHGNAIDFLVQYVPTDSVDVLLFDPPYTVHQVNQCYEGFGDDKAFKQITMYALQMTRIVKQGGYVITFGYNSIGVPQTLTRDENGNRTKHKMNTGFRIVSVMNVCHGGSHNDTIVTVCVKDSECSYHWNVSDESENHSLKKIKTN